MKKTAELDEVREMSQRTRDIVRSAGERAVESKAAMTAAAEATLRGDPNAVEIAGRALRMLHPKPTKFK